MAPFAGFRFQVSGFGCQRTGAQNPDLPPAETLVRLRRNTIRNLQHVVRKKELRA